MANVGALSKVGVALGASSYGTAASSFTRGLLVSSFTANPGSQSVDRVPEVGGTFRTRRVTKGPIDYEASLGFALDVGDAASAGIGDFLACLMGTDTGTLVAGPKYKHKFTTSASAVPAWLNLWSDKDDVFKQICGYRPNSIKVTINSGEGQSKVEVGGIAKTESDLNSDQTLVFSDEPLILASQATAFTVGGSTVTNFDSAEFTFSIDAERFRAISSSRDITNAYKKSLRCQCALSGLTFGTETERAKFKATSSSSLVLTLTDPNSNYITFNFSEAYWSGFEGPNIDDTGLLKMSGTLMATGDPANIWVEIQNTYDKRYDTGATIT
jgi:hypothetical protein